MSMCICLSVGIYKGDQVLMRPAREGVGSLGVVVTDGCKPLDVGAENPTRSLCKSSKHSNCRDIGHVFPN